MVLVSSNSMLGIAFNSAIPCFEVIPQISKERMMLKIPTELIMNQLTDLWVAICLLRRKKASCLCPSWIQISRADVLSAWALKTTESPQNKYQMERTWVVSHAHGGRVLWPLITNGTTVAIHFGTFIGNNPRSIVPVSGSVNANGR